jgi:hypothetical protein
LASFNRQCAVPKSLGALDSVPQSKALQAKLVEFKETRYRLRHVPVPEQGPWLGQACAGI